jgi:hypothetical protein
MTKINNSWEQLLNPKILKSNLSYIALYIMTFELLKERIEKSVDEFFYIEYKKNEKGEIEKEINEDYENKVLSLINKYERKNKFYVKASIKWLINFNILDENDENLFNELRIYRNELTHEFQNYLLDEKKTLDKKKMESLVNLFIKLEKNWILNFEVLVNEDFDGKDIKWEDVSSGQTIILNIIHDIVFSDESTEWNYHNFFFKK